MELMSIWRFQATMHLYIEVIDFQLGLFRASTKPSCSIAPLLLSPIKNGAWVCKIVKTFLVF